jgi:hypothetical protein
MLDYQSSVVNFEALQLAPAISSGETIAVTGSNVQAIPTPNPQGIFRTTAGGFQP